MVLLVFIVNGQDERSQVWETKKGWLYECNKLFQDTLTNKIKSDIKQRLISKHIKIQHYLND